jgi:hypothetical protein
VAIFGASTGEKQGMSARRRYFAKRDRGSVVLPAATMDLPRRRGLLLWLSALAVLAYVTQFHAPAGQAAGACERTVSCLPDGGPAART